MNKKQMAIIEEEINRLLDRMERRDARIEKYEATGDKDGLARAERAEQRDRAKIDGIDFVLGYLGMKRRYNEETGKNELYKG